MLFSRLHILVCFTAGHDGMMSHTRTVSLQNFTRQLSDAEINQTVRTKRARETQSPSSRDLQPTEDTIQPPKSPRCESQRETSRKEDDADAIEDDVVTHSTTVDGAGLDAVNESMYPCSSESAISHISPCMIWMNFTRVRIPVCLTV
jgi:hypothetical protein